MKKFFVHETSLLKGPKRSFVVVVVVVFLVLLGVESSSKNGTKVVREQNNYVTHVTQQTKMFQWEQKMSANKFCSKSNKRNYKRNGKC